MGQNTLSITRGQSRLMTWSGHFATSFNITCACGPEEAEKGQPDKTDRFLGRE